MLSIFSPYRLAHTMLSRHHITDDAEQTSVTDDAGHQQTQLLVLAISRWLRVCMRCCSTALRDR